jgi:TolA-binding protein
MRKYLRTLTTDDSSLRDIAVPRLAEVDQLVIKSYFAQAKVLLARHNFDGARAKYKLIISEYSGTDSAHKAEMELQNVTPISVRYFKKEGDANFHPEVKIGVPQDKAAIFYEKMYKADDSGPLADVALYYWARALSTEGKAKQAVQLLEQHLVKFPKSKETRAKAMYLLGFTYVDHQLRNYKKGIPLLLQVAKDFPDDANAPEALWAAAFVLGWNRQFAQAILLLQQLKKYPKSPRAKYADQWIAKYQDVMQSGARWP